MKNRFEKAFSFNSNDYLQEVPKDWHENIEKLVKEVVSIEYQTVEHQRDAMMNELAKDFKTVSDVANFWKAASLAMPQNLQVQHNDGIIEQLT